VIIFIDVQWDLRFADHRSGSLSRPDRQREIHASTRTTHLANARAIAARLLEKWYASLEEFKQVDKENIRGNAPLLAGAGKISLALFCESFDVGLDTVVPHLWQTIFRCMLL
jgi:hypothetical protein